MKKANLFCILGATLTIVYVAFPAHARQINGTHKCLYGRGGGQMTISGFSQKRNINPAVSYKGQKIVFGELNTEGTFRTFVSGDWTLGIGRSLVLSYQKKLVCADSWYKQRLFSLLKYRGRHFSQILLFNLNASCDLLLSRWASLPQSMSSY